MKTVYFACSVAGGRDYAFAYQDFVEFIKSCGVKVHGELFADPELVAETGTDPSLSPRKVWERDTAWVHESAALIAEVSQPSLGVGYEIAMAESLKKPILALFYKNSLSRFSPMIAGNPHVVACEYVDRLEAEKSIQDFIKKLS